MISKEQVIEALRPIEDPEVHMSIVELDMVRDVTIRGSHVDVTVFLTINGCPLRNKINEDVRGALLAIPGVTSCDVQFGAMNEIERSQFTQKVRAKDRDPFQIAGQEEVSPLLRSDNQTVFLGIASGKGGVGKSTVTANLALYLAKLGIRVGVVDADIYGFSMPNIFGLGDRRPAIVDNLIMPVQEQGVKIISMGFFVPDNKPVIWRGPMLGKMLRNFFQEVHWGDVDVILFDLPPGTGDIALDINTMFPKTKEIIVTTPQSNATEVASRAGTMAQQMSHDVLGVIENMSYFEANGSKHYIFGQGGGEKLAKSLQVPLLAEIPLAVATAGGSGLYGPDTAQGQVFAELAKSVATSLRLKAKVH